MIVKSINEGLMTTFHSHPGIPNVECMIIDKHGLIIDVAHTGSDKVDRQVSEIIGKRVDEVYNFTPEVAAVREERYRNTLF